MGLKKFFNTAGFWVKGLIFKVDQEIQFDITDNPEMDTTGGGFTWKVISNALSAFKWRDVAKGQDIAVMDTVNDQVVLLAPYKAIGFRNERLASVATTDATPTEIDKITDLLDNSTQIINITATAKSDDDLEWGTWLVALTVTKFDGTPVIRATDVISHNSSAGLNAGSLSFAVNGGNIDMDVTGIAATNFQWDSEYIIPLFSTN